MAQRAVVNKRIEIALDSLEAMLKDLSEISEQWPQLTKAEQLSWGMDWDQLMVMDLPRLEGYYQDRNLSEEQHRRYQKLRRELKEAMPIIERLNFYPPPIPLDD